MNIVQYLGVLVLSICLSSLCVHAEDRPEQSAQRAAETWLGHVDAVEYATSWKEASPYFQGRVTEAAWAVALQGVRTPLGTVLSRHLKSAQYTTSVPGAPDGHYVVMQFNTRLEHKQAAMETITFLQKQDGTWKAAGYYIK